MPETITISLDAMGGDTGPEVAIGGAAIAIDRRPDLRFLVYGEEAKVRPFSTPTHASATGRCSIIAT